MSRRLIRKRDIAKLIKIETGGSRILRKCVGPATKRQFGHKKVTIEDYKSAGEFDGNLDLRNWLNKF